MSFHVVSIGFCRVATVMVKVVLHFSKSSPNLSAHLKTGLLSLSAPKTERVRPRLGVGCPSEDHVYMHTSM
jgi:hypothetical protein